MTRTPASDAQQLCAIWTVLYHPPGFKILLQITSFLVVHHEIGMPLCCHFMDKDII